MVKCQRNICKVKCTLWRSDASLHSTKVVSSPSPSLSWCLEHAITLAVNDHIHHLIEGKDYLDEYEKLLVTYEEVWTLLCMCVCGKVMSSVWQQGDSMRLDGEKLEKEGKLEEALETYNMGIICWYGNTVMKRGISTRKQED